MTSVNDALKRKLYGFHYRNRLLLPFKAHFLKVIVNTDIITDFSPASKGIYLKEENSFTDVYFYDYADLKTVVKKFDAIKMIVVEKDRNVFNFDNHIKLALYLEDKHYLKIEKVDEDILFVD